jgi:hypothetical protein
VVEIVPEWGRLLVLCATGGASAASVAAANAAAAATAAAAGQSGALLSQVRVPCDHTQISIAVCWTSIWNFELISCRVIVCLELRIVALDSQAPVGSPSQRAAIVLTEQDLPTKMKVLYSKNLYQIAISMARSQGSDEAAVMEIYQMHGDHLYKKGAFDEAITQYIETIQYVEPSYVIRKFLDAQRILNLTRYLQVHSRRGRID